ncbi:hypothetical protein C8J57DRAFT_1084821, partial [Mycena rebaudengoi]
PQILLHCRGTHTVRTTGVVAGANVTTVFVGVRTSVQTHVDFDFFVDVGVFDAASRVFSARDSDPVYRGGTEREIDLPEGTTRASAAQIGQFKGDRRARIYRGFPPQEILEEQGGSALKSSKSLRQWAEEYWQVILERFAVHANPSNVKQFVYEKVAHGWDLERLREAVLETIHANESFPENEKIIVTFTVPITKLYIKSEGYINRTRRNKFLLFLSLLACFWPFILLCDYVRNRVSPRWSVCGAAYALKRAPADAVASYAIANGETSHATVAEESEYPGRGVSGYHFSSPHIINWLAEWVREWQPTIMRCVRNNLSSRTPVGLSQNS